MTENFMNCHKLIGCIIKKGFPHINTRESLHIFSNFKFPFQREKFTFSLFWSHLLWFQAFFSVLLVASFPFFRLNKKVSNAEVMTSFHIEIIVSEVCVHVKCWIHFHV